ncbi:DUF6232 family protein [Paractinoplanes maris]|uniref:DUF6232 family protein n=1 Tax=Paractinoplanes maris TaxID=1734446 RepID=UPI002021CB63|nr:DUF6232 family protein [Actinoplanes maris]
MSVSSDTAKHDQVVYYPGPAIVVTNVNILTPEGRYRVRDLTLVDVRYFRNPRRMELTAWHEGRRTILYTSHSRRVFEQVRRAVVRAVEVNRRPAP